MVLFAVSTSVPCNMVFSWRICFASVYMKINNILVDLLVQICDATTISIEMLMLSSELGLDAVIS
jgi:hypothetical protein